MPMTLEEALLAAFDDEYRARATYRAVLASHGEVRPFVNIVESEERYGVKVPSDPWPSLVSAPESLEAACEAAIEAERANGALYQQLMEGAGGRAETPAPPALKQGSSCSIV